MVHVLLLLYSACMHNVVFMLTIQWCIELKWLNLSLSHHHQILAQVL